MPAADTASRSRLTAAHVVGLCALMLVVLCVVELLLGRQFISKAGFGLWTHTWTKNTSQWVADPYTFTHVVHGMLFWWLLLPLRSRLSEKTRFLIAVGLEVGWEILENSPIIIERFRAATAAVDYTGDSILNSVFDVFASMLGSWLAWKYDWKWVLALAVAIEVLCAAFARDSLTLSILMLVYPFEAIKDWQMAK